VALFTGRFTSSHPDAVLLPSPQKPKRNRLAVKEGGFLGVATGGDLEHF